MKVSLASLTPLVGPADGITWAPHFVADAHRDERVLQGFHPAQRGRATVLDDELLVCSSRFVLTHSLAGAESTRTLHFAQGQFPTCTGGLSRAEGGALLGFASGRVYAVADQRALPLVSSQPVVGVWAYAEHLAFALTLDGVLSLFDTRFAARDEAFAPPDPVWMSDAPQCNPRAAWRVLEQGSALCLSGVGRVLAVCGTAGVVKVLQLDAAHGHPELQCVAEFQTHFGVARACRWSSDGQWLAVAGEDDLVTLYHHGARSVVRRLHGHRSFVTAVCFAPRADAQGAWGLVSVSEDSRLLFWRVDPEPPRPQPPAEDAFGPLSRPRQCPRRDQVPIVGPICCVALRVGDQRAPLVAGDVLWHETATGDEFLVTIEDSGRAIGWKRESSSLNCSVGWRRLFCLSTP